MILEDWQRLKVYEEALIVLESYMKPENHQLSAVCGFCRALRESIVTVGPLHFPNELDIDPYDQDTMEKEFPEVWKFYPGNIPSYKYWWSINNSGMEKRRQALITIIQSLKCTEVT